MTRPIWLWLALVAVSISYAIATIVLRYHWHRFGASQPAVRWAEIIYWSLTLPILAVAVIFALATTM